MRCPKCSFISYDVVETCVKCGKNISTASAELHGTVAQAPPPAFLRVYGAAPEAGGVEEGMEQDTEMTFDLGGEDDAFIDLAGADEVEAGGLEFSMEGTGEEVAVDFGGPELEVVEESAFEEPQAAAFAISDLAPPEETVAPVEEVAEELEYAEADAPSPKSARGALGLADLKVEGIDLEAAPAPAGKGKVMPAVKTGTALDDFDIDLGDLIPKKKK